MKKNFRTWGVMLIFLFSCLLVLTGARGIGTNSDAQLNSLDIATDSTVTSQNKFLSLKFGGQSWGHPAGKTEIVNGESKTFTHEECGKRFVFDVGLSPRTHALPTAVADCEYEFILDGAQTQTITTLGGDRIQCNGSSTTTSISATDIGDMIKISAIDADTWYCTGIGETVADWTFN